MPKTIEATPESQTISQSNRWALKDDIAELPDDVLMALWTAKYGGEHVRSYSLSFYAPFEKDELMMLSITLFLLQSGYLVREDDPRLDAQVYKPTELGKKLLYGNS